MRTPALCLAVAIVVLCPFASSQWVQTSLDSVDVSCFATSGTNLFAGTSKGVYRTTDNGNTWTLDTVGLGNRSVLALAVSGTNLFAGAGYRRPFPAMPYQGGVYRSTDNGTTWDATSLTGSFVGISLAVSGTHLLAGMRIYFLEYDLLGIYHSADSGASWDQRGPTESVNCLAVSDTNVFAGNHEGVFVSTDIGTSWTEVNPIGDVMAFAFSGMNIFAGTGRPGETYGGVFLSTNNGTSWTAVNSGPPDLNWVVAFAVSGTNLFAGNWGGGVFLSTNNGTSWTAVNTGLTNTWVGALTASGTNLFASTYYVGATPLQDSGVWRRPLSEMVTSIDQPTSRLPHEFVLEQNYPNPFNPTTVVRSQLPVASNVKLAIYDLLGREVTVLVNERRPAGSYEDTFDRGALASGIYFYRIQAGNFVETKRLILLR